MFQELLENWTGDIEIDGKVYTSSECAKIDFKHISADSHIKLHTVQKNASERKIDSLEVNESNSVVEYRITVKKYMTEVANPGFDFMAKWNNNKPMPLRTMTGTIEKETKGMVYMKLHGQAEAVVRCMRCGRLLTNPISKHYGIGPECMSKLGLVRIEIDDVETIKQRLVEIIWEGWIIKSAITEKEEI